MPRLPRSYIKTSFFHVITQGINKSYIFEKTDDIKCYLNLILKLADEQNLKIIAYCIMNNHSHLLIETECLENLSKFMQRLNTSYGKYYNKKYNRVGYVFRNRYKSEGIYTEKHLHNCIRYIYNNPVKAGICCRPEQYPYSNYKKIDDFTNENYIFIDIDEDIERNCRNIIKNFLVENDLDLINIKKEKNKLKELIFLLRKNYKISLRKIAEELNIGREFVRTLYKE